MYQKIKCLWWFQIFQWQLTYSVIKKILKKNCSFHFFLSTIPVSCIICFHWIKWHIIPMWPDKSSPSSNDKALFYFIFVSRNCLFEINICLSYLNKMSSSVVFIFNVTKIKTNLRGYWHLFSFVWHKATSVEYPVMAELTNVILVCETKLFSITSLWSDSLLNFKHTFTG